MHKRVYVAATSQHVGKTTSTLGLVAALKKKGIHVGYCKPVGQEFVALDDLQVDKDAILFAQYMDFKIESNVHSPVILGKGATTAYLEHPEKFHYKEELMEAVDELDKEYEMVIYEGTGHPGVGSVVELNNADVAKMLDASVIMVVEGGIGNTIDKLNMSIALFREANVTLLGVIINKVRPDKIEKVKALVGKKLDQMGIPLLGCLPYDRTLSYPILSTVARAIKGEVILHHDKLDNRIEDLLPGSLINYEEHHSKQNFLLIISYKRLDEGIRILKEEFDNPSINGIALTVFGMLEKKDIVFSKEAQEYINEHKIPVIVTPFDTYGTVVKISQIEVKINTHTPWKVKRAIDLIDKNVDLSSILNT